MLFQPSFQFHTSGSSHFSVFEFYGSTLYISVCVCRSCEVASEELHPTECAAARLIRSCLIPPPRPAPCPHAPSPLCANLPYLCVLPEPPTPAAQLSSVLGVLAVPLARGHLEG